MFKKLFQKKLQTISDNKIRNVLITKISTMDLSTSPFKYLSINNPNFRSLKRGLMQGEDS